MSTACARLAALLAALGLSACLDPGDGPGASGPGLEPPILGDRGSDGDLNDLGNGGGSDPLGGMTDQETTGSANGASDPTPTAPPADLSADGGVPDGGVPRVPVPPPVAVGCVTDVTAGAHTFACDGISHDVRIPADCLAWSCGLILDVHGGTMSSAMEDKNTNLQSLGAEHGYVVLQPSAFGGLWAAGVDDAKVFAFANELVEAFHLDEDRIHMTGFSQGGYMTWRFVCQHTDWLASAAPAAAAGAAAISVETGCTFTGSDVPSGEIPLLYMHGTTDALVDFQNAETLRAAVRTTYETTDEAVVDGDDGFTRTRYTNARGVPFEFIEHGYASASAVGVPPIGVAIVGHCYPGSEDFTPTLPGQLMAFGCEPPTAFHWGEEVIRFFMAHPRR